MLAAAICGLRRNWRSRKRIVPSVGRWYIQLSRPRVNMFLLRSASFLPRPESASASVVIEVSGTLTSCHLSSEPSSSGLLAYPTLVRFRSENSSESMISRLPPGRSPRLAFRAAGFMTTRTSGASPGVMMSWSAKCSWKELTPGRVPVGARISAGKLGSVDRSLPKLAVSLVNRLPVSCMPSPESPASRMTTRSSSTTLLTRPPGAELGGMVPVISRVPPPANVTCVRPRPGCGSGHGDLAGHQRATLLPHSEEGGRRRPQGTGTRTVALDGRATVEQRTEDRGAPRGHGWSDPGGGSAHRRPRWPVHRPAHRTGRQRLRLLQLGQARAAGRAGLPDHRDTGSAALRDRARAGDRARPADAADLRQPDQPAERVRDRPQPPQRGG